MNTWRVISPKSPPCSLTVAFHFLWWKSHWNKKEKQSEGTWFLRWLLFLISIFPKLWAHTNTFYLKVNPGKLKPEQPAPSRRQRRKSHFFQKTCWKRVFPANVRNNASANTFTACKVRDKRMDTTVTLRLHLMPNESTAPGYGSCFLPPQEAINEIGSRNEGGNWLLSICLWPWNSSLFGCCCVSTWKTVLRPSADFCRVMSPWLFVICQELRFRFLVRVFMCLRLCHEPQ